MSATATPETGGGPSDNESIVGVSGCKSNTTGDINVPHEEKIAASTVGGDTKMEKDSDEVEDAIDMNELLLPDGRIPGSGRVFSVSCNNRVFEGWVKQNSPCCAAASVAGAWNAVNAIHRSHPAAIKTQFVVEVYQRIMSEKVNKLRKKLDRMLGVSSEPVEKAVLKEIEARGLSLSGKAEEGIRGKNLMSLIEDVVMRGGSGEAFTVLLELIQQQQDEEGKTENSNETGLEEQENDDGSSKDVNSGDVGKIAATENDGGEEEEALIDFVPIGNCSSDGGWSWRKDFQTFFSKMAGLHKLQRDRPSTAAIGNWGILMAVDRLNSAAAAGSNADILPRFESTNESEVGLGEEARASGSTPPAPAPVSVSGPEPSTPPVPWARGERPVHAYVLMGKKLRGQKGPEVVVTAADSEEKKEQQWEALRSAFLQRDSALLFHHSNHYALVFAMREWREPPPPPPPVGASDDTAAVSSTAPGPPAAAAAAAAATAERTNNTVEGGAVSATEINTGSASAESGSGARPTDGGEEQAAAMPTTQTEGGRDEATTGEKGGRDDDDVSDGAEGGRIKEASAADVAPAASANATRPDSEGGGGGGGAGPEKDPRPPLKPWQRGAKRRASNKKRAVAIKVPSSTAPGSGPGNDGQQVGVGVESSPPPSVEGEEGRVVRQILSARRGQRPSAWLDWEEVRGSLLKWAGYRMMVVQRR